MSRHDCELSGLVSYNKIAAAVRVRLFYDFLRVFIPFKESDLEQWDLGYGPINRRLSR